MRLMGHDIGRAAVAAAAAALVAATLSACGASAETTAAAAGSAGTCAPKPPPEIVDGLPTPEVRRSRDGRLETTLRASYSRVEIAGKQYATMNYEGSVPGPTLAVCPGDTLVVHLENDLGDTPADWMTGMPTGHDMDSGHGQLTNLHTHGFHVSPRGNSDNVFVNVLPGKKFTYEYHIPKDHPPGMYWYHPHRHGYVDDQIYAGMFGAIYVQGGLDDVPSLADVPTRTLVVNAQQLGDGVVVPDGLANGTQPFFLNGALNPDIAIRPGELQRWRILNVGPDSMVKLALDGHTFRVLANDGNTMRRATSHAELFIGPGEREEVLVRGGPAGDYPLRALDFEQSQGNPLAASTLATVRSRSGDGRVQKPVKADRLAAPQEDLRREKVDNRHRLVYSERTLPNGNTAFLLNGKVYAPDRVDAVMRLNKVAEWTLVNKTTEWHTFHIHVNPFQVTKVRLGKVKGVSPGQVRDVQRREVEREDTVKLPPGSVVTVRTKPVDYTGKFVFHCHMVFHEDNGMMGNVEVRAS